MSKNTLLEEKVAAYFGRRFCLFTGSGTTALYVILRALELNNDDKVLYPDNTCETAVNASVFADLKPVFSDIDLTTFKPSSNQLQEAISWHSPKVYIATHLYGLPFRETDFVHNQIVVIEDAAQGYGLHHNDSKIGSLGYASIISFGKEKTLDCGGGGALLTDDIEFYECCKKVLQHLDILTPAEGSLMQDVFLLRRQCKPNTLAYHNAFQKLLKRHKQAYLAPMSVEVRGILELKFDDLSKKAKQKVDQFQSLERNIRQLLKNNIEYMPQSPQDSVLWKLPLTVNERKRDLFASELTTKGFNVSKFFKPLHEVFGCEKFIPENSQILYQKILNITY